MKQKIKIREHAKQIEIKKKKINKKVLYSHAKQKNNNSKTQENILVVIFKFLRGVLRLFSLTPSAKHTLSF